MYIKMERKLSYIKKNSSLVALIGSLITLIGGFFLSYNYIQTKKMIAFDYMNNAIYDGSEIIIETDNPTLNLDNNLPAEVSNDYIGYLSIPKINLKKGFLDLRSSENDVDKNILVVKGSTYPDVDKGNLIIAGHSGTGWKAFFNDLYKLNKNDLVYVSYKDKKYTYKITNIYKQEKTGTVAIYRDYDKTTLTLITCTNFDTKSQTIYISELISVEEE